MEADADPVEAAWQKVVSEWDDERVHERFVALCGSLGRLADAGRRYREVRERDANRAERAKSQIDRVLVSALADLSSERTIPIARGGSWTMKLVAFAICAGVIAAALSALLRAM